MKVPITPRSNVHLLERIEVTLQRPCTRLFRECARTAGFSRSRKFHRSVRWYRKVTKPSCAGNPNDFSLERAISLIIGIPLSIVSAKNLRAPGEKAGPRDAIWKCRNRSCPSTRVCSVAMDVIWIFWFDSTASQASRFAQLDHKYLSAEQRPATRQILNAISFQWPQWKNWI